MNSLKVIKSIKQYHTYCDELERLTSLDQISREDEEIIDLLEVLIEKWDDEHSKTEEIHPVKLLKQLMDMHGLNATNLSKNTGIDKTVLSKIINNKKGFSKDVIRALSHYFKVSQEGFNKPYSIGEPIEPSTQNFQSTLSPINENEDKYSEVEDYIRIIPTKGSISMSVTTYELISKEDKDVILYIPTLKIFGKANTLELAKDNLDAAANKFLRKLLKLSWPKVAMELKNLGWEQNKYKKKNFSKVYIDKNGILRDFDIPVEDRIVQTKKELFAV